MKQEQTLESALNYGFKGDEICYVDCKFVTFRRYDQYGCMFNKTSFKMHLNLPYNQPVLKYMHTYVIGNIIDLYTLRDGLYGRVVITDTPDGFGRLCAYQLAKKQIRQTSFAYTIDNPECIVDKAGLVRGAGLFDFSFVDTSGLPDGVVLDEQILFSKDFLTTIKTNLKNHE